MKTTYTFTIIGKNGGWQLFGKTSYNDLSDCLTDALKHNSKASRRDGTSFAIFEHTGRAEAKVVMRRSFLSVGKNAINL